MKIDYYKSQLLILQNILITFKNKDIEDAKVTSLRKNASILSIKLDKIKNNNSSIKSLNFLKDEISKFIKMNKPTKKLLKKLENKVNVFIDLIGKGNNRNDDIIYLPNNNDIKLIDIKENKKYQLYKFIFWYSFINDSLNKLLDPEINEKTYMEISMELYKDIFLDPIITFINKKN